MAQPNKPTCRETGARGRSHSPSFDQRRRPDVLRTALAIAFLCPTGKPNGISRQMERVGCEQPEPHEGDADDRDAAGEPGQQDHPGDDRR